MSSPPDVTDSLASVSELALRWGITVRQIRYAAESRGISSARQVAGAFLYDREQQQQIFQVIADHAAKLGLSLEEAQQNGAIKTRADTLHGYRQQRILDRLEALEADVQRLGVLEDRLRLLESQDPFILLLNALQHFHTDHLTPAALAQWRLLLQSLPAGGYGGAITTLLTMAMTSLRMALDAVNDGRLPAADLPMVVDTLRMLSEEFGPFATQQLHALYSSIELPNEANDVSDAPF